MILLPQAPGTQLSTRTAIIKHTTPQAQQQLRTPGQIK